MDLQTIPLALAVAISAALAAALGGLGLGRALVAHSSEVRSRLAALQNAPMLGIEPGRTRRLPRTIAVRAEADRFSRRLFGAGTRRRLDQAGLSMTAGDALVLWLATVAGGAVVATAITVVAGTEGGGTVALLGAAAGALLPLVYLRWRAARRARRIEDQLVEFCDATATMLTTGFGYLQALQTAAGQVGGPLGHEVRRFLDEVSLGAAFDEALEDLNGRLQSRDFEVIATALSVQRRTGGNLGEILRGVALTIRDRQSFHRELRTLTARERFSAIIVAVFPLLLAALLTVLLPDVFGRLFTEPAGRIVLAAALGLDAIGYLVARRMATLEV